MSEINLLADIDPFSNTQPDWILKKHPDYAEPMHHSGPVTGARHFQVGGRDLLVKTSYEVFLDGEAIAFHLMVNNEGRLWSHLCPYRTFATAPELISYILEHAPDALVGLRKAQGHGHHEMNHHEMDHSKMKHGEAEEGS